MRWRRRRLNLWSRCWGHRRCTLGQLRRLRCRGKVIRCSNARTPLVPWRRLRLRLVRRRRSGLHLLSAHGRRSRCRLRLLDLQVAYYRLHPVNGGGIIGHSGAFCIAGHIATRGDNAIVGLHADLPALDGAMAIRSCPGRRQQAARPSRRPFGCNPQQCRAPTPAQIRDKEST